LLYLGEKEAAERVEQAVRTVLVAGEFLTGDLGGKAGTNEFADAVISALEL